VKNKESRPFHDRSRYVRDMTVHEHLKVNYKLANGEILHRKASYVNIDRVSAGELDEDK
jgi:hypothetical protein